MEKIGCIAKTKKGSDRLGQTVYTPGGTVTLGDTEVKTEWIDVEFTEFDNAIHMANEFCAYAIKKLQAKGVQL